MNINPKYQNGKIYTIRCKYDDTLIYVGSTIQKLCVRMASHRCNKGCSLYQYVNGDWNNWYIELYEDYPCGNKNILEKREGEVIRLIGNINKVIAGRTRKEWCKDNADKLKEYRKEYHQNNHDKIKQYYKDNIDKILEQHKQHYQDNRDKILEQQKQYHQNNSDKYAENNKKRYEANRDKILEQQKKYKQANRDKILEQKKQYQKDNANKIAEKKKEKIECDKCKSIVRRGDISTHKKTKKCLNYNVNNN